MIRSASAHTFEIDEPEAALAEIRRQLDEKLTLCKNTVGILQCDPEFIESGVAAHIGGQLGFPVVGCTTSGLATGEVAGDLMLTLLVLTSDDAEFVPAHTKGLASDLYGATQRSFAQAAGGRQQPPKLIVAFPPIVEALPGDWYVDALERQCGKVPVFGSLSVADAITEYDRCATLCGAEVRTGEMAYLLVYGNVAPRFLIATVPQETALPETGVITRAKDNIIYEINGVRAIDFFERVGLAENGVLRRGITFVPFLMSERAAGRPFVRGLIRFGQDGFATCRGAVYEGATFTIGSSSSSDVIASTLDTVRQLNREEDVNAALLFSCIVRRTSLGADPLQELEQVRKAIRPGIPFTMSYSGGEIAPTAVLSQGAVNRFHNFSFIACLL